MCSARRGSTSRITRRISSSPCCRSVFALERQSAGQQLVQEDAERVHVGARVDVQPCQSACSGLMYSGVPTRTPISVKSVRSVSGCVVALAIPKSMIFGTGLSSCT